MAEDIGASLTLEVDSGTGFVTIAKGFRCDGLGGDKDILETTNFQTAGRNKTFIGGFRDGGEVTFEANYDKTDTTHHKIWSVWQNDTDMVGSGVGVANYRIDHGSWTTPITFAGIMKQPQNTFNNQELMTISFTVKITGGISGVTAV